MVGCLSNNFSTEPPFTYTHFLSLFKLLQQYGIDIGDRAQPLLVSKPKQRDIRARGGDDSPILLVPELCTRTGQLVLFLNSSNFLCSILSLSFPFVFCLLLCVSRFVRRGAS